MYSTWTVSQLKNELKARGGSVRGRKADLVDRLQSYDRNFNFGYVIDNQNDEMQMNLPAVDEFHDLNSSTVLPPITKEHIRFYFLEFEKSPEEGKRLYESRYLNIIRAAKLGEHTYIKGFVKAAMKRVQYEANIKIHCSGNIEECMCECVAGSGTNAHCKHVAVVLFATVHMVESKIVLKHQVSTEQLQSFHKPKNIFNASPIAAIKLPLKKRKLTNIIFSPYKAKINVQEYNAKVRSLVLNCSSQMPLKQTYEPANPVALALDHDYCHLNNIDSLLDQLYLLNVTVEKAVMIEMATRGQRENKEWFKYRECRLTASIFHTICSLRPTTQKEYSKQILYKEEFNSRATTHGRINEKVALNLYMQKYGLNVKECGLFVSVEKPYLGASPDGLLHEETIIEIKCPYASRHKIIDPVSVPYLFHGSNGLELKKGSPYYFQVQGQMYCCHRKWCNFIVYTDKALEVIYVERDEEFIENHMLPKL